MTDISHRTFFLKKLIHSFDNEVMHGDDST